MRFPVASLGIAVLALAAVGCSERSQPLPAGPRMQAAAPPTGTLTCDFKSLSQLATHYFSGTEAKVVRGILSLMDGATDFSATARSYGFDVMTHIAQNVRDGNTDVADASNLTNGLIACMYMPTDIDALPAQFPEDFSVATDPATFGAYEVRGGTSSEVVFSRSNPPLSGVAPDGTTWGATLAGNSPVRALLYGAPGLPNTNTYEWRVVPRNATFNPAVLVGVCFSATDNPQYLLHEEHVGLLPYRDAGFLPGGCPPSVIGANSWTTDLASRLLRWGTDVFGPRPLSATTVFDPGGLAGSTGSLRSLFGPENAATVVLTFEQQPSDVQVNATITPEVTVKATNPVTGSTVANVSVSLIAFNNNGVPAELKGGEAQLTDYSGIATFDHLSETKTGGYVLTASGVIANRTITVLQATSTRFNVRP